MKKASSVVVALYLVDISFDLLKNNKKLQT
jgi:hypothetical protein